jgi:hypothetical protein
MSYASITALEATRTGAPLLHAYKFLHARNSVTAAPFFSLWIFRIHQSSNLPRLSDTEGTASASRDHAGDFHAPFLDVRQLWCGVQKTSQRNVSVGFDDEPHRACLAELREPDAVGVGLATAAGLGGLSENVIHWECRISGQ